MSSFMMYVAVIGAVFPTWANAASGLKTDATTRTFTIVFFIAFLPDVLFIVSALTDILYRGIERLLHRRRPIQRRRSRSRHSRWQAGKCRVNCFATCRRVTTLGDRFA